MWLFKNILLDGAVLSVLATLFILVSLYVNPRIWLQDYPEGIQAAVPPKTEAEKRLSLIFGIPFLLVLFSVPLISTITLKHKADGHFAFSSLFLNAAGVAFTFNLIDWLLLDWLMFCAITPKFVIIPGTEGMQEYKDYFFHFRGFLTGTVFSAVAGLVIASGVWFIW
jgi:hypothetical protein